MGRQRRQRSAFPQSKSRFARQTRGSHSKERGTALTRSTGTAAFRGCNLRRREKRRDPRCSPGRGGIPASENHFAVELEPVVQALYLGVNLVPYTMVLTAG